MQEPSRKRGHCEDDQIEDDADRRRVQERRPRRLRDVLPPMDQRGSDSGLLDLLEEVEDRPRECDEAEVLRVEEAREDEQRQEGRDLTDAEPECHPAGAAQDASFERERRGRFGIRLCRGSGSVMRSPRWSWRVSPNRDVREGILPFAMTRSQSKRVNRVRAAAFSEAVVRERERLRIASASDPDRSRWRRGADRAARGAPGSHPTGVPTTGVPLASASAVTIPKPS